MHAKATRQEPGDSGSTQSRPAGDGFAIAAPTLSLPKSGGAIRDIGEKFAANPVTGTASLSVPIATSPGRSGFGPQLSLSYDSGNGNGPFGFGWSLSLPSIGRKTDKGLPQYRDADNSDIFILSGAEDLVPEFEKDAAGDWLLTAGRHTSYERTRTVGSIAYVVRRYRPRIEGLFARVERWTQIATGETHWRSITRDNVTTLYGTNNASRIFDPHDPAPLTPTRIFSWLISASYDDKGNAIVYEYAPENDKDVDLTLANERNRVRSANRHLKRIVYGNRVPNRDSTTWRATDPAQLPSNTWMFEVIFDYDEAHYATVDLFPSTPAKKKHEYALASPLPGRVWTARPDPYSSHRAGFEVRSYRRCRRVLMFHHIPDLPTGEKGYDGLVKSTEFAYVDFDYTPPVDIEKEVAHRGSSRFASFMSQVTQSGYVRDETRALVPANGVQYATYLRKSLPPVTFEFSTVKVQDQVRELDVESAANLPQGVDGSNYQWIDLDGEGLPGILTEQGGAWFYKPNRGDGSFGSAETLATVPSLAALSGRRQQLLDLAGDGQLDLVAFGGPTPGFYERTADRGWEPFRAFQHLPNIPWDDPNLRFIDLDGDGHADVLITDQDVFTWYPSGAEDGFAPARTVRTPVDDERGARLVLADGTQSIYLADMCGDGLTDLVRVRNGEVCYWANVGYGRFGAKVTMDDAPRFDHPDQFDQRRIRLADIDGSGTTDIIYLGGDGVDLYFNQSGNRWSHGLRLPHFPQIEDVSSVTTADLLGNGTACLVWSSPLPGAAPRPLRYVDLMGGNKPHLLIKTANNLGAQTEVQYASSTRFYLDDKRRGRPWVTRLPMPIHVIERVVVRDLISGNRFVTRYAYHHGYFDGVEREFRGFGLVEQWDTEELAVLNAGGQAPAATNLDAASHVPPILTKTWFHTGAYLSRDHVSDYFAGLLDLSDTGEYYREPGAGDAQARALLLDDTVLPGGLTADEEREACRALRGSMLRQEVYAVDATGTPEYQNGQPYVVTEQNFTIRPLQPRGGNVHAVFFAHARESLAYHYERTRLPVVAGEVVDAVTASTNPAVTWLPDPRVAHTLTLEVDLTGNVLRSASVQYGRRYPDRRLPSQPDRDKQAELFVAYVENRLTKDHDTGRDVLDTDDERRTPLPCESRTYEITGLTVPAGASRFMFDAIDSNGSSALTIDYETSPAAGSVRKRLIEHLRTYYRRNDLTAPLPLQSLQSLALPFESHKLAFTPGLITGVYGGRVDTAMLAGVGGYVHTEGDASWWVSSGRMFYSPGPADLPAQELAHARRHYFLPHRYRDPFHTSALPTERFVSYDDYDILVQETQDPLKNRITVGERNAVPTLPLVRRGQNYRVLQPALVMDPNRNCSEVRFDALGLVVGTAVMGKPEESPRPGDLLTGTFVDDLTDDDLDTIFADPKGTAAATLLDAATTRVVRDLLAYTRNASTPPAATLTLARETHASDPVPTGGLRIQTTLSYSDGFGREIQKKVQAEPGPVPVRDAAGVVVVDTNGQPQMTASDVSPRWVGSGWTVFNNKGKPVRQYEPFFTHTHRFEVDVRIGVSPILYYDPLERVVATLHPNHTWEKVVFDPWRQERWDVNDTVLRDPGTDGDVGAFFRRLPAAEYQPTWHALRTDPALAAAAAQRWPDPKTHAAETRAAAKAAVHAATPAIAHADSLGRAFLTIAHNKYKYSDTAPAAPPVEELQHTRIVLDIEGNQREVIDARDRVVMRYDYDVLGNRIHQANMDAGERWTLNDVAGKPLYAWDSRDHRFGTIYDPLRRPTDSLVKEGTSPAVMVGRTTYGEGLASPETGNRRGQIIEIRDQAGIVGQDQFDFKGNLLHSSRQLAQRYDVVLDWSGAVAPESETFHARTRYDALSRPIQVIAPHSDQATITAINVIQPRYNEANLLRQVDAWLGQSAQPAILLKPTTASLHAVTDIDYDAKGQRTRIDHGTADGMAIRTSYTYDHETFRLQRLYTRRGVDAASGSGVTFTGDCENPQPPPTTMAGPEDPPRDTSCGLQNLRYTYDPAGNITDIRDGAQQVIYFRNRRVEPSADYTYDAIYRLIEATGREHLGQAGGAPIPHTFDDAPRAGIDWSANDGNAMGRYLERYVYDQTGNIRSMEHTGTDPVNLGWTRTFACTEPSLLEAGVHNNHLTSTAIGTTTDTYSTLGDGYDAHGNMLRLPHLQGMQWDFNDRLRMTQRQASSSATAERTWYVYDAAGQRVRKVTVLANGGAVKDERIYLGGFEIYRRPGAVTFERETLQVMDDTKRIALVDIRTKGVEPGVPKQLVRYQFSNHLDSATLELDDSAQILSYEEYTPYGSTSYQAVRGQIGAAKRYRYTAKERDDESGLYYHGARSYAPWLARWTSADPMLWSANAEETERANAYWFVRGRPTIATDPTGRILWFVVIIAVAFTALTVTSAANAPTSKDDKTYNRVSDTEYAAHVAVNVAAAGVGEGAAVGVFGRQALRAGATSTRLGAAAVGGSVGGATAGVGNRAVSDVAEGKASSPGTYVSVALTGAVVGAGVSVTLAGASVALGGTRSARPGAAATEEQIPSGKSTPRPTRSTGTKSADEAPGRSAPAKTFSQAPELTKGPAHEMIAAAEKLVAQAPPNAKQQLTAALVDQIKKANPGWEAAAGKGAKGGLIFTGDQKNLLYMSTSGQGFKSAVITVKMHQAAMADDVSTLSRLVHEAGGRKWGQ